MACFPHQLGQFSTEPSPEKIHDLQYRHPEPREGSKETDVSAVRLGSFARLRMTVAGVLVISGSVFLGDVVCYEQ